MGSDQSLRIVILTGDKRTGKTTWLQQNKANSSGFLSPVIMGKRHFVLIPDQLIFPMEEVVGQLKVGKYSFSQAAFIQVEGHVQKHFEAPELIFDEIGPLEIRGEGFSDLLKNTIAHYSGQLLLVVRTGLVDEVVQKFRLDRFQLEVLKLEVLNAYEDPGLTY